MVLDILEHDGHSFLHMQRMSISLKRGTKPVTVQTASISNIYSSNRNMTVLWGRHDTKVTNGVKELKPTKG